MLSKRVSEHFQKTHLSQEEVVAIKPCIERKQYLSGIEERFVCEWIAQDTHFGILKHTAEVEYHLGSMTVLPGDVSYRFHWPSRSYNLCKIYNSRGELLGNCFNLADSVGVSDGEIVWRDLNVDILVLPSGETKVVNGDDRTALRDTWLQIFIEATKQELLRKYQDVIIETDKVLFQYRTV